MREIKFIDRPEVLDPCSDCGEGVVCAKCKSDIAWVAWCRKTGPMATEQDLLGMIPPYKPGKNWYGEDGLL